MKKSKLSFLLIIGSMLLLIGLEVWWLHSEYHNAVDSFERETDLVFKSTIKQVTDSALYGHFRKMMLEVERNDSLGAAFSPMGMWRNMQEGRRQIKIESIEIKEEDNQDNDNKKITTLELKNNAATDSLNENTLSRIRSISDSGRRDFRFIFDLGIDSIQADSIQQLYGTALKKEHAKLKVQILQMDKPLPTLYLENDSLPFTTDFYRLGRTTLYAAQFEDAKWYVIRSMLPKIGFSIVLTTLVLLSFIVLHKSKKTQERLLDQKNEFIANMTHELKTPVATVGVALEAIRDFDVLNKPEKAQKYLDMASKEVKRLNTLTDKILKASIFDYQQEIKLNMKPVDLVKCMQDVAKNMELAVDTANMKLELKIDNNGVILGHDEYLSEMIHNLVENAVKYAGKGVIRIHLFSAHKKICLNINDEGPGISEEHLSKVMQKFYRVPTGDVHNIKGYGLGLSYVAGVVKSHQGEIKLENIKNGGLSIKICFPKHNES